MVTNVKFNVVVILALFGLSNGVQAFSNLFPDDTNCNDGFIANKGSDVCYKIVPDAGLNYWEASEFCAELDASLMEVANVPDLLLRLRTAEPLGRSLQLRILGYQVSETEFKDNEGNLIKLPTLEKTSKHTGSLTILARRKKEIRVFGNKPITDKLGLVCQRERQGRGKPIKKEEDKDRSEEKRGSKESNKKEGSRKSGDKERKSGRFISCGSRVIVPARGLQLVSHRGYDEDELYPNNYFCSWLFSVQEGEAIELSFQRFELEGVDESESKCFFDNIQAYDGRDDDSESLYKHPQCGDELPASVESSGRYLNLTFVSDDTLEFDGFVVNIHRIDGQLKALQHPETESCRGQCGKFVAGRKCQCDDQCSKVDDCCSDYKRLCY